MSPKRALGFTVLGCVAGSGLALAAARQTWRVTVTPRPAPLSPLRETATGADLLPWLPAVALVGLAAGVALYATRRTGRLLVSLVAVACGLAIAGGGGYGLISVGAAWPAGCLVGGLLLAAAGGYAAVYGRDWPTMGARYGRPATAPAGRTATAGGPRPDARAGSEREPGASPQVSDAATSSDAASAGAEDTALLWDALDAGTDPTEPDPTGSKPTESKPTERHSAGSDSARSNPR